jgi:alpha-L-rhamnosidase
MRGAAATDIYITNGNQFNEANEIYQPHFTVHGFRYVEIRGLPYAPKVGEIEGVFVHSDVKSQSAWSSTNPTLNQIQSNVVRFRFFS